MADYDALAKQHGGAPSQPASQVDYDALAMQMGGQGVMPIAAPDSIPQRVKDYAGSIARGVSPYAASSLVGGAIGGALGAAGGPPGMIMGAQTGARLGPLALTAADIATGLAGTTTPSELVKRGVTSMGVGPAQPTREQQLLEAVAGGAASGYGLGSAFSRLAGMSPSPVRNVLAAMGKRPDVQMFAGGAGAGAPVAAQQYFDVTDPYQLAGISLGGSLLGGAVGSRRVPPAPSVEEWKNIATDAYEAAKDAKVVFSKDSYQTFLNRLDGTLKESGFDPDLQTQIATVVNKLKNKSGADISAEELENARRIAQAAGKDPNKAVQRFSKIITNQIDEFVTPKVENPSILLQQRVVRGDVDKFVKNQLIARDAYKKASRGEVVNELLDLLDVKGNNASQIQQAFYSLYKNKQKLRQFDKEQRDVIRSIAKGSAPVNILKSIGEFAPFGSTKGLGLNLGAAAYELFGQDRALDYIPQNALALAAATQASKYAADRMLLQQARRFGGIARGGEMLPNIPLAQISAPAAVNVLETSRRLNALGQ